MRWIYDPNDPASIPTSSEEYEHWREVNGLNHPVSTFEMLMENYLEARHQIEEMEKRVQYSAPTEENARLFYSLACKRDLAAQELFRFLVRQPVEEFDRMQAVETNGEQPKAEPAG